MIFITSLKMLQKFNPLISIFYYHIFSFYLSRYFYVEKINLEAFDAKYNPTLYE